MKSTPKEKNIVKIAAENNKFKPSDDLFNDILKLAAGLRERGLSKQADQLEDRMLVLKLAKEHIFDDLLDFAYPEGNIHISDAKEGWGQILTPQNQAKKIRETVEKGSDIKTAAALIRIRTAQLEDPGVGVQDDGRIAAIKKKVDDAWENIRNARKNPPLDRSKFDFFKAPLKTDEKARNLYKKYSGVNQNTLVEYYNVLALLSADGKVPTIDSIQKMIRSDLSGIVQTAQRLGVQTHNYINGVSGSWINNKAILTNTLSLNLIGSIASLAALGFSSIADLVREFPFNPKSIYLEVHIPGVQNKRVLGNTLNIKEFAEMIYSAFIVLSDTVFGKRLPTGAYEKIAAANEKLSDIYNKFIEDLASVSVVGSEALVDRGEINIQNAVRQLNGIRDNFIVVKNSENTKAIYEIVDILDADAKAKLDIFWKNLGDVINQAERSIAVGNMNVIVTEAEAKNIGNNLRAGSAFWVNLASTFGPGSEERKNANENADRLSSLAKLVKFYANKPFMNLFSALNRWAAERALPEINFRTLNEFKNFVASLIERPKTSSRHDYLIKIAQANPWLKPVGKTTTPAQRQPNSGATVTQPQKPSAVMDMQKELNEFGKSLENSAKKLAQKFPELDINKLLEDAKKLQNTGNQNTPFDGQWGPKTDAALKIFNEYATKFDSTITEISENIRNSDVFEKAKSNINSIIDLVKKIDFAGIISGVKEKIKQYDSVFRGLMSGSWAPDNIGDIPVRPGDFESLPSFYMFLQQFKVEPGIKIADINNRFVKVSQNLESPDLVFKPNKNVADFDSALNWFLQRAYVLYWTEKRKPDGQRDDEKVDAYAKYFNDVKSLQKQWQSVRDNFKNGTVTLGGLMNAIEGPQAEIVSYDPRTKVNSDGADIYSRQEDENLSALNKRPFTGNILDIIRLSKKYKTRYRNWFVSNLQHGLMNLENFDGGHPPELWTSYRKPDDTTNPAKFFKMFLLLAQKDIAEAFSKWVKRVYNLPAQEANRAIAEQQEKMQEWMSVLNELVARTERILNARS